MTAALAALGIEVGGRADGCPVVVAAVENDRGGGIAVAVREGTNRSEGRVVSDATLAAAWIDSWIHDDFAPEPAAPGPVLSPPAETARIEVAPVAAPTRIDRFSLDARYQRTFDFAGNGGSGFAGGACVRVGAVCVGGEVAFGSLDVPAGISRSDASIAATASYALTLGNVVVSPEVALGAGRVVTDACPMAPMCDPTQMMCAPPPPCTQTAAHQETYTPRLGATLRASVALFPHVWLEGTAAIVAVPLAHVDPSPGSTDASGLMPGTLPGEPGATAQLAVGIRVGAP